MELLPSGPLISIERGDDVNVTCQSHGTSHLGHSYLSWYRLHQNGSMVEITDSSMVWRTKSLGQGGHNLDNEILMFRNFSKDRDAGNYTCRYDNNGKIVVVSVVMEQKRKPFFFLSNFTFQNSWYLIMSAGPWCNGTL